MNTLCLGIDKGDGKSLSILFYADDIVLLAKGEGDLQLMNEGNAF